MQGVRRKKSESRNPKQIQSTNVRNRNCCSIPEAKRAGVCDPGLTESGSIILRITPFVPQGVPPNLLRNRVLDGIIDGRRSNTNAFESQDGDLPILTRATRAIRPLPPDCGMVRNVTGNQPGLASRFSGSLSINGSLRALPRSWYTSTSSGCK